MIAEFTLNDGNPVSINMEQVDYFQPSNDGTLVAFSNGQKLEIRESYDAVAEVTNPERQAG